MADPNRAVSRSARTKAFTGRTPAMFSCSTVFSRSSFSCTRRNRGSIFALNAAIRIPATASTGTIAQARPGLVANISAIAPSMDSGARVPILRETWITRCTAAVSLARRTMSPPVEKRSMRACENPSSFTNTASRRSRATPSPTRIEALLLSTAAIMPVAEMPSMIAEVPSTTFMLFATTPSSMIRCTSRGMERSVTTIATSIAREKRDSRQ